MSNTNVSAITATTTSVPNVVKMINSEPANAGIHTRPSIVSPMLPTRSFRWGAGTVRYQRNVASTPRESIDVSPASPW